MQPAAGAPRVAALLSFRLGGTDGVALVADTWARILRAAGWTVVTVAGAGPVDRTIPGLAWPVAGAAPSVAEVADAVADADVVVVENLCSLPLNPPATDAVAAALRGRPAVLHHHDLPWQRERFADVDGWPPDDPAWRHVTINEASRADLAARGISAVTIYNGFDVDQGPGDRDATRAALGVEPAERLLLHPVRAIARKDVPAAIRLAEALAATYWLTGPAEEDHAPALAEALAGARCRVLHRPAPGSMAGAYAAADAVAFTSTWEGFGNPLVESALHRRPLAVRRYPVASELAALGFEWFDPEEPDELARFLEAPDEGLLDRNRQVAIEHFSLGRVGQQLFGVLDDVLGGTLPR